MLYVGQVWISSWWFYLRIIEWNNKRDVYAGIEAMGRKTWSLWDLRELMEILRKPLNVDVLLRLRVFSFGC